MGTGFTGLIAAGEGAGWGAGVIDGAGSSTGLAVLAAVLGLALSERLLIRGTGFFETCTKSNSTVEALGVGEGRDLSGMTL